MAKSKEKELSKRRRKKQARRKRMKSKDVKEAMEEKTEKSKERLKGEKKVHPKESEAEKALLGKKSFPTYYGKIPEEKAKEIKEKDREKYYFDEWREDRSIVEYKKGKALGKMTSEEKEKKLRGKDEEIADQTAQIMADLIERGVTHGDTHAGNIIVNQEKGKLSLSLVDFDRATQTSKRDQRKHYSKDKIVDRELPHNVAKSLYPEDREKQENLKEKINKKLEEKIEKL